ncbi:MAG TPA: hypothetical protein VHA52_03410, partial [Candidatus Babeliaceae bacterium]|nr:hypothetical protein [Candidatus Babeliaceae bacterium]
MLEQIRAWLNGSRDYFKGVALYMEANKNVAILEVLQLGPNEYRKKRLYKELHDIYEQLKTSCAN